jgi:NhaA family Na+:H+ antiporter
MGRDSAQPAAQPRPDEASHGEAGRWGPLLLAGATVLALVLANSPLAPAYFAALDRHALGLSVLHWINDGGMALFFLMVGMEIKRELAGGALATWRTRALPGIAAAGGMAVPALIYVAVTAGAGDAIRGWAVPAATDIAFALGVLAVVSARLPPALKLFLTALAIIDDLGAIAIIALFYTAELDLMGLGLAAGVLVALWALNRAGVRRLWPYLGLGAVLWYALLLSGVHATLAGVAVAFSIPLDRRQGAFTRLEHALQPWVACLVVPVFGLANAGIALSGDVLAAASSPVALGVAAGLFAGKQVGVFAFAYGAIRAGIAVLPEKVGWRHLYGASVLSGIGFTMSLFIGYLAFPGSADLQEQVKLGVLAGSVLSGVLGLVLLWLAPPADGSPSSNPPSKARAARADVSE